MCDMHTRALSRKMRWWNEKLAALRKTTRRCLEKNLAIQRKGRQHIAPESQRVRSSCHRELDGLFSLLPYKSLSRIKIISAQTQNGIKGILPKLTDIFRNSFCRGFIPSAWTKMGVTFIPKADIYSKSSKLNGYVEDQRLCRSSAKVQGPMECLLFAYLAQNPDREQQATSKCAIYTNYLAASCHRASYYAIAKFYKPEANKQSKNSFNHCQRPNSFVLK